MSTLQSSAHLMRLKPWPLDCPTLSLGTEEHARPTKLQELGIRALLDRPKLEHIQKLQTHAHALRHEADKKRIAALEERYQNSTTSLLAAKTKLAGETADLRARLADTETVLNHTQEECVVLQVHIEERIIREDALHAQLADTEVVLKHTQKECVVLQAHIEERTIREDALQPQLAGCKADRDALAGTNADLSGRASNAEYSLELARQKLADLEALVVDLKTSRDNLASRLNLAITREAELEKRVADLEATLQDEKQDHTTTLSNALALKARLDSVEAQNAQLVGDVKDAKAAASHYQACVEEADMRCSNMSASLDDAQDALAAERQRSASLALSVANRENEYRASEAAHSAEVAKTQAQLADALQENTGLLARLGSCETYGKEKDLALADRDQELEALRLMVADLQAAFSQEHAARLATSAELENARQAAATEKVLRQECEQREQDLHRELQEECDAHAKTEDARREVTELLITTRIERERVREIADQEREMKVFAENDVTGLKQQLRSLREEVEEAETTKRIAALTQDNGELAKTNETLRKTVEDLTGAVYKAENTIRGLRDANGFVSKQYNELMLDKNAAEKQHTQSKQAADKDLALARMDAEKQLASAAKKHEKDLIKKDREIERLQGRNAALVSQVQATSNANDELRSALDTQRTSTGDALKESRQLVQHLLDRAKSCECKRNESDDVADIENRSVRGNGQSMVKDSPLRRMGSVFWRTPATPLGDLN
ncbi:uncharacterized protein LAESUDRAFT_791850 [Laetiporus sulphureus 93-53]|uniref:Uncharacterized protein n=1 Tax=Laetiporus sulphureus 93-53 TaxID=1314785 RepID=A0A165CFF5_9APHY|nr:uncharacterized protein LAESUDRAFT_791850 [Laetiporus sulphureus 93-53]KZT02712.1 hypothetical protein LAESUDRAFT_791850 [Laetiporus sulphureus 93-53]